MKVYIVCCAHVQISYLKKNCSWDMDQNALSQSGCRTLKATASLERNDEIAWVCMMIQILKT